VFHGDIFNKSKSVIMDELLLQEWFTRRQVAQAEGVCPRTIAREIERGRFPAGTRFPNRRLYWHRSVIEAHRRRRIEAFGIGVPAAATLDA
jgi:IS30 family transposase